MSLIFYFILSFKLSSIMNFVMGFVMVFAEEFITYFHMKCLQSEERRPDEDYIYGHA